MQNSILKFNLFFAMRIELIRIFDALMVQINNEDIHKYKNL